VVVNVHRLTWIIPRGERAAGVVVRLAKMLLICW